MPLNAPSHAPSALTQALVHACQRRPAGTETPLVATELPLSSLSAFTRCNLVHGTDCDSLRGLPPGPCTYRTARRKVPPLQAKRLERAPSAFV